MGKFDMPTPYGSRSNTQTWGIDPRTNHGTTITRPRHRDLPVPVDTRPSLGTLSPIDHGMAEEMRNQFPHRHFVWERDLASLLDLTYQVLNGTHAPGYVDDVVGAFDEVLDTMPGVTAYDCEDCESMILCPAGIRTDMHAAIHSQIHA